MYQITVDIYIPKRHRSIDLVQFNYLVHVSKSTRTSEKYIQSNQTTSSVLIEAWKHTHISFDFTYRRYLLTYCRSFQLRNDFSDRYYCAGKWQIKNPKMTNAANYACIEHLCSILEVGYTFYRNMLFSTN